MRYNEGVRNFNSEIGRRRVVMAKTLNKEERKELARKAMEDRAKEPAKKQGAGFAQLDADAKKLQN